ncbi:RNA polymerase sigma-I factor [Bacillus sporothermodurans]|uniref:RNA polymerase sigma-I factor n=1 Tax=Heyndrickxia sporothermodurans TaxID=46224 RepID=UPI00192C3F00|nr:RNA polymerase sigma-I factor [Heyndrickxia sporothermodurans]MBL5767647.1 RNA polymerase sigma-I factor [Heyndrickxia sporothermodurans]MBL5771150.1 RNA polymerase sigma-I factor [Heyndrickxia sporothermodurans]MBL5775018.1 RNA polymerase sigma-I factor [Heyndrickxia sporothermodurans]MBL5785523.1 RNA polymerase sigma-I factor [Heyndrickxia sporothermodurans]MBL5789011.1 RNA polymerase sigma-I factor [Heyndrickxia sporothermodurans]
MLNCLVQDRKQISLEEMALLAQHGDENILNQLLQDYQPFIKKTVSSVCKHYINDSDDEFSIGLIVFHDSILKFDESKGASLLSFAEVIIKRRVIDYLRSNNKYKDLSFDGGINEDESSLTFENTLSVEEYNRNIDNEKRKDEINRFANLLQTFGLKFKDLIKHSPKHEDARINAIQVAKTLVNDPELLHYLNDKKRLPIKMLESKVNVSRKTLERNRKYIIAIALIISLDFVYLREYVKGRLSQ